MYMESLVKPQLFTTFRLWMATKWQRQGRARRIVTRNAGVKQSKMCVVTPLAEVDQSEMSIATPLSGVDQSAMMRVATPNDGISQCEMIPVLIASEKKDTLTALLVLPDGRLIVANYYNAMIQMFDMSNVLIGQIVVSGYPYDMTAVGAHQIVVSLQKKLQFITTMNDRFVLGKAITTTGQYYGVSYCDNRLVVTDIFDCSVKVLDMSGNVLTTLRSDFTSQTWFTAINQTEKVIYVSDHGARKVTCMTMDGTVLNVYKHNSLLGPWMITVHPDGTVYVGDSWGNGVHHITSQCTHIETLLKIGQVDKPRAICFNPGGDKMYMSEDPHI